MEQQQFTVNGTRTYRRVTASGEVSVDALPDLPEVAAVHHLERSLSDFLPSGHLLKRSFDICVSTVVLTTSLPLLGLIALAIRSGSRGPVFHNVFRTGMGFRVFKVYGFRTTRAGAQRMVENLSHLRGQYGANDALVQAPTRLGRFLRRTGLDMLPMFLNVLLGDLSLVGNRALPLHEATRLVDDATCARFEVPAGIWGPGGRNDLRSRGRDQRDLLEMELSYVRERSFLYDLRVLFNVMKNAGFRSEKASANVSATACA